MNLSTYFSIINVKGLASTHGLDENDDTLIYSFLPMVPLRDGGLHNSLFFRIYMNTFIY